MNGIRIIFLVFLSAVTAYFIHSGFKYTRMISNIFLSLVYRPEAESFSSSMGEVMTILDSNDHEVEVVFAGKPGVKKLVIFCHESGALKESWEKYAYFFPDLGYQVLSLDLGNKTAGFEANSLSQWPTENEVEKVVTAIRWAKKAARPDLELVLFGVSNGADIALAASFRDPSVTAVVADGLFSMKEIFRDYIRKWAPILVKPNFFGDHCPDFLVNTFANLGFWYSQKKSERRFVDVEKLLKKPHPPLLVIHGQEDHYVSESHQRFLEKLGVTRERFDRLVVPKASHNQAVIFDRELYEQVIKRFLGELS